MVRYGRARMSSTRKKTPKAATSSTSTDEKSRVPISSADKLMFPAIALTKAALVEYYEQIAPLLLPHLFDRPLTLERFPDGVLGETAPRFYQKNTPAYYPSWIPRVNVPNEEGKPVHYTLCNDVETLRYLVNQCAVTFHVFSSRASSLDRPDYVLFDLDPGPVTFSSVIRLAHALRSALVAAGHEVFVKTSGKSGLHLLVPWRQPGGYTEARSFATQVGKEVIAAHPDLATLEIKKERRGGKIYLDVMPNVRGHHIVPAYVVRALPSAPVSMPLRWDEVQEGLHPAQFSTVDAVKRAAALGDPLAALHARA